MSWTASSAIADVENNFILLSTMISPYWCLFFSFSVHSEDPPRLRCCCFTRSFSPSSTLGSIVDSLMLFSGDLFSMDIRSSSWYSLMWSISQWAILHCCVGFSLAMSYAPWYLYLSCCSLGTLLVEQVAGSQMVESTDIFCYCFLDGQIQLVHGDFFH